MKLHVPANFIGYGTFSLAAMVAFAYLIKQQADETRWYKLTPIWLLGVALCFVPIAFRQRGVAEAGGSYWLVYAAISALIAAGILLGRRRIAARLPAFVGGARRDFAGMRVDETVVAGGDQHGGAPFNSWYLA